MGSGRHLVTYGIPTATAACILAATVVVPGRSDARVAPRIAQLAVPEPGRADLSGIGTGDFQLGFTIRTTARVPAAIINQRARCEHGNFWDVRMAPTGELGLETDGGAYTVLIAGDANGGAIPVNDGVTHAVLITRTKGTIQLQIDKQAAGTAPSAADFGALAPLAIFQDVCVGVDGTEAIEGAIANVILTLPRR
jgi:hypothetical protein